MADDNEISDFEPDKSGINSLGGFAYQIKVFILFASKLQGNNKIEFEALDDVTFTQSSMSSQDIEDAFNDKIVTKENNKYTAIQVKRTEIKKDVLEKILINWILLESLNYNISSYILVTSNKCDKVNFKSLNGSELLVKIKESKKRSNANISKVKSILEKEGDEYLLTLINAIVKKSKILSFTDIDTRIETSYRNIFNYEFNTCLFNRRLKEFLYKINNEIIDQVLKGVGYSLSTKKFQSIIESICLRINENRYEPYYHDFIENEKVDITSKEITESREYRQLNYCKKDTAFISDNILRKLYYEDFRIGNMQIMNKDLIKNLEKSSYTNFQDVKEELIAYENDAPLKRFIAIKKRQNQATKNEDLKVGSCIFLTRKDAGTLQISWKDTDD